MQSPVSGVADPYCKSRQPIMARPVEKRSITLMDITHKPKTRRTVKRGNNEGSIAQLADGCWQARISLDGRRKAFYGATRAEAD